MPVDNPGDLFIAWAIAHPRLPIWRDRVMLGLPSPGIESEVCMERHLQLLKLYHHSGVGDLGRLLLPVPSPGPDRWNDRGNSND
jgi:hypothetical protein